MNEFLQYQRTIFTVCLIGCCIAIGVTYAVSPASPAYAIGMALGSAAGLFKFRLDVMSIIRFAQNIDENKPNNAVKTAIHTYIIMFGAMLVAISFDQINHWTTFAGMMLPRLILMADGMIRPSTTPARTAAAETNGGESE